MTPIEAFAAVGLVAVACDGVLDSDEANTLRRQLALHSPYQHLGDRGMEAMFDTLLSEMEAHGWEALLARAVPVLTPPQQETALAMAAQLVQANRSMAPVEKLMLDHLVELVSIPAERCAQILEVVQLLNRDCLAR